jgi:hypothetical protein
VLSNKQSIGNCKDKTAEIGVIYDYYITSPEMSS